MNAESCPSTFKASLADQDDDILYWRAFVDYARGAGVPGTRSPEVFEVLIDPSTRTSAEAVEFLPRADAFIGQNPHAIELFVADRPFSDDRIDGLEGRHLTEADGLTDSFVWTVIVDDTLECPGDSL